MGRILPNFDPLPPLLENRKHFQCYLPFVHVTKHRHSTDQLPTFCDPRSYKITPGGEGIFFENFVVNLS